MNITFVGTGSIGAKNNSASYLINNDILIDMPNGNVKNMKQLGINIFDIETILITHLHGDHYFDLPFFFLEKYYNRETKNIKETTIYCPKGTVDNVEKLHELAFPGNYQKIQEYIKINFVEFDDLKSEYLSNGVYVDSVKVTHSELLDCYGYILKQYEKKVAFSGDSTYCEQIESMVQESDVSILDLSLASESNKAHMGLNDIEKICNKKIYKTIVATHMQDYTRNRAKERKISNLIVPEDGQVISI